MFILSLNNLNKDARIAAPRVLGRAFAFQPTTAEHVVAQGGPHFGVGEGVEQGIERGAAVIEPQAEAECAVGDGLGGEEADGPDQQKREPADQEAAEDEADRLEGNSNQYINMPLGILSLGI
jgi:hypothetical protein